MAGVGTMADDRDARIAQLEADVARLSVELERSRDETSTSRAEQAATAEVLRVIASSTADVDRMLDHAPATPESQYDVRGRPAFGREFARPPYRFAKPLSDPLGGTAKNKGRHLLDMYI